MNLLRKAAFAATSTILLTTAGAMSGIGSSAAQAYDVDASPGVVVLHLTGEETASAALAYSNADALCMASLSEVGPDLFFSVPTYLVTCAPSVSSCSKTAPGQPRTVVFYFDAVDCRP